jgi:60kDa lysophospholipase
MQSQTNCKLQTSSSLDSSCAHLIKDRQVLILYTGGTIGMMKGEHGLTPRKNFLFEYLYNHPNFCDKEFTLNMCKCRGIDLDPSTINENNLKNHFLVTPEFFADRRIFYTILEFDEIIDSANMNLEYWKMIGRTISKYYNDFDAFIVLHGTDTMNYTACVLSFMLENLNKPVILTGSQIPLIEMRNDALKNLVDALIIAGAYHIPEVTLMFDSKLFRGNRTIKNDNMGLRAFESPNLRPLVEIGINIKVNWDIILPPPTNEFTYFEDIDSHISVVKFFPIIKDSTFESFFKPFVKAVIIETYGAGKLPKDRERIVSIIQEADKRGVIIVNVSQCRKGTGFNLEGDFLAKNGVVNAGDMTVECCLAKLSYLLGKGYLSTEIKTLIRESLRGEINTSLKGSSMHSSRFVDALLNLMDKENENEENLMIASTLLPTVINELVEKNNLTILKKMKNIIKMINFSKFGKKNPLHIAAIEGHLDIIKFLLKCRVNINEIDEDKFTPLNYACSNRHREVAYFLKSQGAILNLENSFGEFFCSLAYQGDLESIKLFYECGANLMIGDYDKKTLAHVAASCNKVEIVEYLVKETNLNLMVEDRWGNTPYADATSEEIRNVIKSKFRISGRGLGESLTLSFSKKKRKRMKNRIHSISNVSSNSFSNDNNNNIESNNSQI